VLKEEENFNENESEFYKVENWNLSLSFKTLYVYQHFQLLSFNTLLLMLKNFSSRRKKKERVMIRLQEINAIHLILKL
jgi:hypothetical protein